MTLVDTAEMYGDGRSESLVAQAIAGVREKIFLVTKVLPSNASRKGVVRSCEASLMRLKTDRVELCLLHWMGSYPLEETVRGFEDLLAALPGGRACVTDQVLYNLSRRGIEFDLLPWCFKQGISVMAYSPVEQGRILGHKALKQVAQRLGATPAQVALAGVLRQDGVVAIPKAGSVAHVRGNRKALDLKLDARALSALDQAFPPPKKARPLEMI